ncbi:MAG: HAMP domain-containing histidine kinase [Clostridia bacterium]|nr:HAMP domain-containing histidine kinase [Clostridia bacterium]
MKNTDTKDKHTKNKFKKQKRKLFSIVAVGLLVLSIAMCSIFTALIYNKNLELLYNQAAVPMNVLIVPKLTYITNPMVVDYTLNLDFYEDNNVEVIVKYKDSNEIYTSTRNCQPKTIGAMEGAEEREIDMGTIEYDSLRASMTDKQYNKIIEHLTVNIDDEYKNYRLYITEYYYQGTEIKPVKADIVKNTYEPAKVFGGKQLVDSEVVESFEFKPSHDATAVLRTLRDDFESYDNIYDRVIETEFLLGEYKNDDLLAETEGLESVYFYEDIVEKDYGGPPMYFTGFGEFVLEHEQDIPIKNDNGDFTVTAIYLEKVNVLEYCIGEILMMCGFVLYMFAISGVIIGAVLWKAMKKQLEQEERLRTVTNSMAHQLKTPLFEIGGYAENLAENVNTDKRTHYAQVITEQTNAMNEMVCKMLDYSRLDSESFALNIERFELTEVAKEIIENYKLDNSQLECKKDVYIEADKKLIKSVVENLIDNAVKYSTDISKISIKINNNTLSVSNPYKALTNKELDDMWKPYYRSTEKEKSEGHGLGLAIVKSILDLHKFKYNAKYSDGNIIFSFEFK